MKNNKNLRSWLNKFNLDHPLVIAGPCSAETETQMMDIAEKLNNSDVSIFRAGIWKPRTRPGMFEGVGAIGLKWLKKVHTLGAGEIIINSINYDGLLNGLDIELGKIVSSETDLPVILSGGAGRPEDFFFAFKSSQISGIAAGAIFQFTEYTPRNVKDFLKGKKIKVRNNIPFQLISEYSV